MENFLTTPEEILLISVGENGGVIPHDKNFEVVLAASVLMDLAINDRLDSDLEKLIMVSDAPLNDIVLDESLEMIFSKKEKHEPSYWVSQLAIRSREFTEYLIASLILKKVLKVENQKLLWVFSKRKYPLVKDKEIKEVKLRVREMVFGNDIPGCRDIVIISLLHYGQILPLVFSESEIKKYKSRIENIARMDLIGQAISKSLTEFVSTSFSSVTKSMLGVKSPEEKLNALVKEMKEKFRIADEKDLPGWLRKGTAQYQKTLDFITKTGSINIYYHRKKDQYFEQNLSYTMHDFGSGA
jgi:golgi phosphoprotein 3